MSKNSQEQVDVLRQENAILKEEGAVGGTTIGGQQPSIVPAQFAVRTQELSRDMMLAATTAETNLRLVFVLISLALFANDTTLSDFY